MIDNFSASFEATTNKFEKDYSFLEGHLNTPPYNAQSPQIDLQYSLIGGIAHDAYNNIREPSHFNEDLHQEIHYQEREIMIEGMPFAPVDTEVAKTQYPNAPTGYIEIYENPDSAVCWVKISRDLLTNPLNPIQAADIEQVTSTVEPKTESKNKKTKANEKKTSKEKAPRASKKKNSQAIKDEAIFISDSPIIQTKVCDDLKIEPKYETIEILKAEDEEIVSEANQSNIDTEMLEKMTDRQLSDAISRKLDQDCITIATTEKDGKQTIKSEIDETTHKMIRAYIERKAEKSVSDSGPKDKDKAMSQAKSYFNKNFPKKLGDALCDFVLDQKYHGETPAKEIKEKLKDGMSWKKFNNFLDGTTQLCGEINPNAFRAIMIEFVLNYDLELLEKSKTKDEASKYCHKIGMKSFKAIFAELKDMKLEKSFKISKAWPSLQIEYSLGN